MTNVTIADNWTYFNNSFGAGIFIDGIQPPYFPGSKIVNSIVWGNGEATFFDEYVNNGTPTGSIGVTYSNIEGGFEGEGNINLDPLFVDSQNGNFTLESESPCINTGNPNLWYNDMTGLFVC